MVHFVFASGPVARTYADVPTTVTTGLWSCELATEHLTWSDGVYDLFGLPRDSVLDRGATAAQYTKASRIEMECRRVAAIRDKAGFTLDAEILVDTVSRWIRIVARVECVNGRAMRLSGSKTDVTYEYAASLAPV